LLIFFVNVESYHIREGQALNAQSFHRNFFLRGKKQDRLFAQIEGVEDELALYGSQVVPVRALFRGPSSWKATARVSKRNGGVEEDCWASVAGEE
jgi:hypothetical protein